jgi:hypothetical protein
MNCCSNVYDIIKLNFKKARYRQNCYKNHCHNVSVLFKVVMCLTYMVVLLDLLHYLHCVHCWLYTTNIMRKQICKGYSYVSWGILFCCKSSYCTPHTLGLPTTTHNFAKFIMYAIFTSLRKNQWINLLHKWSFFVKFKVFGPVCYNLFYSNLYSEQWLVSHLAISVVGLKYTCQHIHAIQNVIDQCSSYFCCFLIHQIFHVPLYIKI